MTFTMHTNRSNRNLFILCVPDPVHLEGAYKLSQELRAAGTVPQYAG